MRSPSEYIQDHIPGATNFPAVDDNERSIVGTLYKQTSTFEARKQGASFIAGNVARYLKTHFSDRDEYWHPLIYCWRGGNRSKAFTHILQEIGWQAVQLPGGYKSYRALVRNALDTLPPHFDFKVLCGRTGVGKSLLLKVLEENGAQVLDLEYLANHRGSVLGNPVEGSQPSQKYFESLLCKKLQGLDCDRPVYVEAESRKIGKIQLPDALLNTIRSADCIRLRASLNERTAYLTHEYRHFLEDRKLLNDALKGLTPFLGKEKIRRWTRRWETPEDVQALVVSLLTEHYDPIYVRSMQKHFHHYAKAQIVELESIQPAGLQKVTEKILSQETRRNFGTTSSS